MIKFFHYRNFILRLQNQRSGRPLVEIAACGENKNEIYHYDQVL